MFCSYVSDSRYGWVAFCEKQFGDVPSQICFESNTPQHTTDDAVPPRRRAFAKAELQHLFEAHRNGSKRWLTALRDSTAFKIGYAYGLRRRELVMLDVTDFGPNPNVPRYGNYGALTVRWAKGTKGSGPRRRTVLTSPEFAWAVELLEYWCVEGRELFSTADRSPALWPSERGGRLTLSALYVSPAGGFTGGAELARAAAHPRRGGLDELTIRSSSRAVAGWAEGLGRVQLGGARPVMIRIAALPRLM